MTKLFLTLPLLVAAPLAAQTVRPAPATSAPAAQVVTRADLDRSLKADFAKMDTDANGSIGTAEIEAASAEGAAAARKEYEARAAATFKALDKDGNGQISEAEFRAGLPPFQPPRIDAAAVVRGYDKNKDGKISLDEYGARKVAEFQRYDVNKDGKLSAAEQNPGRRAAAQGR